ncbi:MAG: hypothetical protein WAO58_12965 [Fimbriimonadaceae bacterium]
MRKLPLLLLALPSLAVADLHYWVRPDLPAKSIRVAVKIDDAKEREELRIPAWCPGFYFLLEYQKKISDVRATGADGAVLSVSPKPGDPRAWIVENPSQGPVTFSYSVLGDDGGLGFFGVSVKNHTTFINGPSAFVYPVGRLLEPTFLKLNLPSDWKVATGMMLGKDGWYEAGGYDELIDHPLQLGIFETRRFNVEGVPFEAVFVAPTPAGHRANLDDEAERLRKLSIPAMKLFGGIPAKKYVYLIHLASGDFGGGLEHRASTVMSVENTKQLGIDTLATHEFFHTWNVKQQRPAVLGPFDYTQPVRTKNLWFAEGVTDYYANITAYRGGLMSQEELLRTLGNEIRTLQASKTRRTKTLEDTSMQAWENGGFGVGDLSYYNKGLVAGLVLDAAIRSATEGRMSLDDVQRLLYKKHALPKAGYSENGILEAINEIAEDDLTAVYNQTVRTTKEVPYELLAGIGLSVRGTGNQLRLVIDEKAGPAQRARLREWLAR